MKDIICGDPHGRVSTLPELKLLFAETLAVIKKEKPERVIILGDLFNDFSVLRLEVLGAWSNFIIQAGLKSRVILIVGNHDQAGAAGEAHALEVFKSFPNVTVVDRPSCIDLNYFMPFMRDNAAFIQHVKLLPENSILFCHQSFNGAKFDNGFYDPHGVDPAAVGHLKLVVSGHIHLEQKFANIYYPGTPYQTSFGEQGEDKGIFLTETSADDFKVIKKIQFTSLPTYHVLEWKDLAGVKRDMAAILDQKSDQGLALMNIKVKATGAPSEIADFWADPEVKIFKSKVRRVVDALSSVKPEQDLAGSKEKTHKEKLDVYIKKRKWRTSAELVASRAEEYLARVTVKV